MSLINTSVKSSGITDFYQEFEKNPLAYVNQEIPSNIKGVDHFWITRSMLSMFDKSTDKMYDFNVALDPKVLPYEPKKDFLNFVGKALNVVNNMIPDTEIPYRYIEDMGSVNFKQKDGNDDLRTFHITPLIIKGNDVNDFILYFGDMGGYDDVPPNTMINVYNLDGAKMADSLLTVWFAANK